MSGLNDSNSPQFQVILELPFEGGHTSFVGSFIPNNDSHIMIYHIYI